MLKAIQLDDEAQRKLVAALSLATLFLRQSPIPMGRGAMNLWNDEELDIIVSSLGIMLGGRTLNQVAKMTEEEQNEHLNESKKFISSLISDIAHTVMAEQEANASV